METDAAATNDVVVTGYEGMDFCHLFVDGWCGD